MTGTATDRLARLGLVLPAPMAPVATYVPFVRSGQLVFVSGQGPVRDGTIFSTGRLGAELTVKDGYAAARLTALNLLAQLRAACDGDLDRVARVVRLLGFVASTPGFTEHDAVMDGASDLLIAVFGETGRHARAVLGSPSLPFRTSVEIEAIFELA